MKQPAKRALKEFAYICHSTEEYQQKLVELDRIVKTKEWATVVQILWNIKNKMASDLVGSIKVTNLDPTEKDIVQRVYHEVNEMIDFLTRPLNWVNRKGLLARGLSKVKKEIQNDRGN